MLKNCVILMLLFLLIPCTAVAADVYLKDGGIIKCFFAKQHNGVVYVLINRDTEIELDSRVVALKKTFQHRKMIGSHRRYKSARQQR